MRDNQRWIDVGVILGTLVAYEGQKPIFATLVSSGRDRLGTPELADPSQAITKLGTFEIVSKAVTLLDAPPERMGERYSLFESTLDARALTRLEKKQAKGQA